MCWMRFKNYRVNDLYAPGPHASSYKLERREIKAELGTTSLSQAQCSKTEK